MPKIIKGLMEKYRHFWRERLSIFQKYFKDKNKEKENE
jgi:hypothetical protein